jgi:hypothetical protein
MATTATPPNSSEDHPTTKVEPTSKVIVPKTKVTVPLGQENAFFRQTCDTLDRALHEWKTTVSDFDKDHNIDGETIILNIPTYISETVVYGKRVGKDQYWEGGIELWPGDTRVMKLRLPYGENRDDSRLFLVSGSV